MYFIFKILSYLSVDCNLLFLKNYVVSMFTVIRLCLEVESWNSLI